MITAAAAVSLLLHAVPAQSPVSFDAAQVRRVEARLGAARLTVTGTDDATATVEVKKLKGSAACRVDVRLAGDLLQIIETETPRAGCEHQVSARVPHRIDADLAVGAGMMKLSATDGGLKLSVGSGNMEADVIATRLTARGGSGDVRVRGLTGLAEVTTGSGNIELTWNRAPAEGEIVLRAGSGNATLNFPSGARLRTAFAAGSGRLINEVGDTPGAKLVVSGKFGSGDLRLRKGL